MNKRHKRLTLLRGDRSLWIIIGVLCVVSLLVVYSSTASMAYRAAGGDTTYYVLRQLRFIVGGFFTIVVVHWIDYRLYARYAKVIFRVSLLLVVGAYFVGVSLNDAARWIRIPVIGLTFQPSDPLKISLVMILAAALGQRQGIIDRIPILPALSYGAWKLQPHKNLDIFTKTTKPLVMPIFWAALVVMPSNLSTASILVFVCLVMLWVGRVRPGQIIKLLWVAFLTLILVVSAMKLLGVGRAETWINRVESFVEPVVGPELKTMGGERASDEFQKEQAKIAIASGGAFGKGPGNSTQRSQLPHPYSDFAYAFIVEEYGALGGIVIFLLYLWVFYRAGVIVRKCNRPSSALMVLGLALTITFQAFINMLVSVGLVPVTGQSLPLISLGGSSVIFTCIAFGMILSVSRESDEDEAAALAQLKIEEQNNARTEEPDEPNDEPDDTDDDADDDAPGDALGDDDPFIVVENPYAARNNLSPEKENINLYENNS
ncbi:MAG: FtsW/RodA/SpoVE family cell cycle protein [Mucinivorans sp.]